MISGQLTLPHGSKAAGARLYWQSWLPVGPIKAAVLLVHGYAEHLGRYKHVAASLNAQGLAVYALDHWGHGQSDGTPGFVPAFSVFTDGLEALLAKVEAAHPGLPLVLVGHSMGGLIAATHLVTHQKHYTCAVLSGPAIAPGEPPSALTLWIGRLLSRIAPRVGVLALDANGVSRDPAVVAAYKADPLVYSGKIGARLGNEMLSAMTAIQQAAPAITLPVLILHGALDSLAAPHGSQLLFDQLSSSDKTLKVYPGLFHEIFNEPEQDAVIAEMNAWIAAHLPV